MNPEVEALLHKAADSLTAAEKLMSDGFFDFTASRAYYSMFYVAQALLLHIGHSYSKHSAIISAYGREFAMTKQINPIFHRWLIDAQDFRNIGDYGIGTHIDEEQAREICGWARDFIESARRYLHENVEK